MTQLSQITGLGIIKAHNKKSVIHDGEQALVMLVLGKLVSQVRPGLSVLCRENADSPSGDIRPRSLVCIGDDCLDVA
jgi:hypothetical protein